MGSPRWVLQDGSQQGSRIEMNNAMVVGPQSFSVTREAIEHRYFDLFVQGRLLRLIKQRGWTPRQEFFFYDPKHLNLPSSLESIRYSMLRKGLQLNKHTIQQALTDRLRPLLGLNNDSSCICVEYVVSMPNCWPELTMVWQDQHGDFSQSECTLFSEASVATWAMITTQEHKILQTWTMGLHARAGRNSSMRRLSSILCLRGSVCILSYTFYNHYDDTVVTSEFNWFPTIVWSSKQDWPRS